MRLEIISTNTRVGNKVKSIYIKGSITLTANQENQTDDQGGEEVVNNTTNGLQYLRTSWRIVIVKDTQSNSTDPQITWDQVFSSGAVKSNEEVGGITTKVEDEFAGHSLRYQKHVKDYIAFKKLRDAVLFETVVVENALKRSRSSIIKRSAVFVPTPGKIGRAHV